VAYMYYMVYYAIIGTIVSVGSVKGITPNILYISYKKPCISEI